MEPHASVFDSSLRGRVVLALQRAIVVNFNMGDWQELGYLLGHHEYIANHERLLRSLKWGDDDYSGCVFQFLSFLVNRDPPALYKVAAFEKVKGHLSPLVPLSCAAASDRSSAA